MNDKNVKILVVDDDPVNRILLKKILKNNGYINVETVNDGKLAWELVKDEKFDLIISDVEMPNMNGIELVKNIYNSSSKYYKPKIPVIVASSNMPKYEESLTTLGVENLINKPIFQNDLLERMESLLKQSTQ